MLEWLELENYQSHEKTRIEFSDGVTAIVGSSDSGKTAVLRALGSVLNNDPMGDYLISHWAFSDDKQTVPMILRICIDGVVIERYRKGRDNHYVMGGEEYNGAALPDPIAKFLNLSDVNLQSQHDPIFLLDESPSQVARRLNRVVNLDEIDVAVSNIASDKRAVRKEIDVLEEQVRQAIAEEQALDWIDPAMEAVHELVLLQSRLDSMTKDSLRINLLLDDLRRIDLESLSWLDTVDGLLSDLELKETELVVMDDQFSRLHSIRTELSLAQVKLSELGWLEVASDDLLLLESEEVAGLGLSERLHRLSEVRMFLSTGNELIDSVSAEIRVIESEWDALPKCDKCGQPLEGV